MTQMYKDRKKNRQCKRMQGFKGEVYDSNAKERARHTHPKVCSLPTKKKRKRSMLNKTTTNEGSDHHQIIVGDLLLHSETKIIVIQVVIHSLAPLSSIPISKPIIHRLSPNSSGINPSQTIVPCDLKNTSSTKSSSPRTKTSSSSKKLLRMHKAGLALVKEFKSKVITPNHDEPKTFTPNTTDDRDERTHL